MQGAAAKPLFSHFVLRRNRLDVQDVRNAISISPGHLLNVFSAIKDADFSRLRLTYAPIRSNILPVRTSRLK